MTDGARKIAEVVELAPPFSPDDLAPPRSEEAIALKFAKFHADELRFVAAWNRWLIWDGIRWRFDDTRKVFSFARKLCRDEARDCNPAPAQKIASAKTRAAVVSLAGEDRQLAATVDQWDADPWLLNTPGGVVDLRTGVLRCHRAVDYMTKITAVTPDEECLTPLWDSFFDRATNKDKELQAFLQRVLGYSLTGVTNEHALFFLHGSGGNGKGVFMNTAANILGDFHRTAPIETFTASNVDQHPTDLAMLRGARLVAATETEEGRRWAESRIKTLTGGDRVSARFMRQDFFEYTPQFKLMISGNHKPGLRSVDEAIRRRLHLIPFTVTVPANERDKELGAKLVDEYPGILAWMIKGCLQWQRIGLAPPKVVTDATSQYLNGEDVLKTWLDECCDRQPEAWTAVDILFANFRSWAEFSGEHIGTIRRFSQRLSDHGFKAVRRDKRGFAELVIKKEPPF